MILLAPDVIAYNDGGGKAPAAINAIKGADKVVRFLIGVSHKLPAGFKAGYLGEINGQPGVVFTLNEKTNSVMTLDLDPDGRILALYFVVNPDKIRPRP